MVTGTPSTDVLTAKNAIGTLIVVPPSYFDKGDLTEKQLSAIGCGSIPAHTKLHTSPHTSPHTSQVPTLVPTPASTLASPKAHHPTTPPHYHPHPKTGSSA